MNVRIDLGMLYGWLSIYLVVVAKFDGSLRLASKDGRARMASAAATLMTCSQTTRNNESILWFLGARHLDSFTVQTSGQAEFEGLILALEGILIHQESIRKAAESECLQLLRNGGDAHSRHQTAVTILVQGDCKTAIQQMQGRSRSRKLESLYQRACQLVRQIPWTVQFEHLPRNENMLCDRLCHGLLASRQNVVIEYISNCLMNIFAAAHKEAGLDSVEAPSSLLEELQVRYLCAGKSILSGSCRLKLYSILVELAWCQGAYKTCHEMSRHMQKLADDSLNNGTLSDNATRHRHAKVQGTQYEVAALRAMRREKEAVKVERRVKTLLLRHGREMQVLGSSQEPLSFVVASEQEPSIALRQNILKSNMLEWKTESQTDCFADFEQILEAKNNPTTGEAFLRATAVQLFESLSSFDDIPHKACWVALPPSSS